VGLGQVCYCRRRYVDAVHFYECGLDKRPDPAADPRSGHRHAAACAAVLAADGQGEGAERLTVERRGQLRQHAVAWLREDLAAWTLATRADLRAHTEALEALRHRHNDRRLAPTRDAEWLARLSAADAKAWLEFWAEAGALRRRLVAEVIAVAISSQVF
jgi:hypothetical protein